MAFIEIKNLTKKFGETIAVDHVNLQVDQKELMTILGPSGTGKTTILRLIAGFLAPDAGEIVVDGKLLSSAKHVVPPEKRNFGMVFQSYALWPHLTVWKNVAFGLKLKKLPENKVNERVQETLRVVKLEGLENRYPSQLSGGQQQRVSLARSLVVRPKVLLLDEPLSNLDAKLRETMRLDLVTLQKTFGITSVYVTHDQAEAMVISDRVAVMNDGRIVQVGSPRAIYETPKTRFVADFVGSANFISGQVLTVEGKTCVFLTDQNEHIYCNIFGDLKEGDNGLLSIRAENIRLRKAAPLKKAKKPSQNVLVGTVERCIYLGSKMDYWVSTGERLIRASQSGIDRYEVGSKVYLTFDPERCILIRAG